MGRKAARNSNLPPHLRRRTFSSGNVYYYYDTGKKPRHEIPLGSDYPLALKKWAELEGGNAATIFPAVVTVPFVLDRYERDELPTKKPRTQKTYSSQLKFLRAFFSNPTPAPLDQIEPITIAQYLASRKTAPIKANKEVTLFSGIWNLARAWGYTKLPNPCEGIKHNPDPGRDVYVDDWLYKLVYDAADQPTRDAMELAYLTGQRPSDVLKMQESDVRDNMIFIRQAKGGDKLRIEIIGELKTLIDRIHQRKHNCKVSSLARALIVNEKGQPLTQPTLRNRFDKARAAAGVPKDAFQFRDLRAKAGTEKEDRDGLEAAQHQLGHRDSKMTRHYVRNRIGKLVKPTR